MAETTASRSVTSTVEKTDAKWDVLKVEQMVVLLVDMKVSNTVVLSVEEKDVAMASKMAATLAFLWVVMSVAEKVALKVALKDILSAESMDEKKAAGKADQSDGVKVYLKADKSERCLAVRKDFEQVFWLAGLTVSWKVFQKVA